MSRAKAADIPGSPPVAPGGLCDVAGGRAHPLMTGPLRPSRTTRPDPERLRRCVDAPQDGPRIVFLTGGTALRHTCRHLKRLTHNSVHLMTPFDSGGSSAALRAAYAMPSVGDLRSRLLALADETGPGSAALYEFLAYRLSTTSPAAALRAELQSLADGSHALTTGIAAPDRSCALDLLGALVAEGESGQAPLDLRGASVGNLVLAGAFLRNGRDLDAATATFAGLVQARGLVHVTSVADAQLVATLADGTRLVGQHRITGKEVAPISSPIRDLGLAGSTARAAAIQVETPPGVVGLIERAELLCFPVGSFWTSVVANLLPRGVGRAVAAARCPKVYIPNLGADPEQLGMSVADCIETLRARVERDVGRATAVEEVVDTVLVDSAGGDYGDRLDLDAVRATGVRIVDLALARDDDPRRVAPDRLAEALATWG